MNLLAKVVAFQGRSSKIITNIGQSVCFSNLDRAATQVTKEQHNRNRSSEVHGISLSLFLTNIRLLFFLGLLSSVFLYIVKSSLSAFLTLPFEKRTVRRRNIVRNTFRVLSYGATHANNTFNSCRQQQIRQHTFVNKGFLLLTVLTTVKCNFIHRE